MQLPSPSNRVQAALVLHRHRPDSHALCLVHAGQRCTEGHGKNTYGTGCFLLVHTGARPVPSKAGLLSTMAYQLGPDAEAEYALEGSIGIAGAAISWMRDQMGLIESDEESETLARQVEDTGAHSWVTSWVCLVILDIARTHSLELTQM